MSSQLPVDKLIIAAMFIFIINSSPVFAQNSDIQIEPLALDTKEPDTVAEEEPTDSSATKANKSFDDMTLEQLLDISITSASKEQESVSEAPSSVTVFTSKDIKRLGVRTIERLLNFVPGFQGTTDNGNGVFRISVRGRNTIEHDYILVLVDGQRLNDMFTGGAINPIAIENVEQVEIIRGPGSALYGANAFLGVIDIKTNRKHNNAMVASGDLNNRYVVINLAKKLGALKVAAFAKHYCDDGYIFHKVTDIMGNKAMARDPVQELDSSLSLKYEGLTLNLSHTGRRFSGMSCCTPYSWYSDRTELQHSAAHLAYSYEVNQDIDLNVATSFAYDNSFSVGTKLPAGAISGTSSGVTLDETYILGKNFKGFSVEGSTYLRWQFISTDSLKGSFITGGLYNYTAATRNADVSSHDFSWQYQGDVYQWGRAKENRTNMAGYLQAKIDLFSQIQFTAGGRYDWYSDFGKSFNPRAALVYLTPLNSHLKVMVGKAFRAPSFVEQYEQPQRTTVNASNELKPEELTTYEIGYAQKFLDYAQGTMTFFHTKIDNIIQPPQNILPYRNSGESIMQGLEFELRTRDIYGFNLLASYTHLMPREKEKTSLIVPYDYGAVALSYSWKMLLVNLNAIIRGASKIGGFIATNIESPSFLVYDQSNVTLLNCHLQVELPYSFKLFTIVENILDSRFNSNSRFTEPPPGLLNRGRTFYAGIKVDF
ncbi:MAG: TonB-dependent receptor [Deltaproteobacteria bacterium]|nr:TonB-dependent receptor [Deltaproteobacteria bacterium]